jgi:hypothetical protein
MTTQKHLKERVRARMAKTGESYVTARRHVIRDPEKTAAPAPLHFPGNVPGATVLRILLTQSGVRAPHTSQPFTEAMVFGIAGGIGAGMFSFHYEKEDFSSFYIAGRHLWWDNQRYLAQAARRFGRDVRVREAGGAKAAFAELRDAVASGPAVAWVDAGSLAYRAMPALWEGGGYHVLVVYGIDEAAGTARLGDLTDEVLTIPLDELARARARIKKDRNRVLQLDGAARPFDLQTAVRGALRACADNLVKQKTKNLTLAAFDEWAERLHGSAGQDAWEKVFRRGAHLWTGLTSVFDFTEHYGTGGGLGRPLFSEFLSEAADALDDAGMRAAAEHYAALGARWSELAEAALPAASPPLAEARALLARKTELFLSEGAHATDGIRGIWARLEELKQDAARAFPLSENASAELRRELQQRVRDIAEGERAGVEMLRKLAG